MSRNHRRKKHHNKNKTRRNNNSNNNKKPCRFAENCTRKDCWFDHPNGRKIDGTYHGGGGGGGNGSAFAKPDSGFGDSFGGNSGGFGNPSDSFGGGDGSFSKFGGSGDGFGDGGAAFPDSSGFGDGGSGFGDEGGFGSTPFGDGTSEQTGGFGGSSGFEQSGGGFQDGGGFTSSIGKFKINPPTSAQNYKPIHNFRVIPNGKIMKGATTRCAYQHGKNLNFFISLPDGSMQVQCFHPQSRKSFKKSVPALNGTVVDCICTDPKSGYVFVSYAYRATNVRPFNLFLLLFECNLDSSAHRTSKGTPQNNKQSHHLKRFPFHSLLGR